MFRFMRILTMLMLMLWLSACQSLLLPVPVAMPAETAPQAVAPTINSLTTPLFTLTIALDEPRDIGSGELGIRYMSYFTGGAVTGPDFAGEILANGENWYLIRLDSVAELVIQGALKTDEGEQIAFKTLAFARMDPARIEQILSGELIDPTRTLFRGVTFFTTEATQHAWLNDCVTLATLTYDLKQVRMAVYVIDDNHRD